MSRYLKAPLLGGETCSFRVNGKDVDVDIRNPHLAISGSFTLNIQHDKKILGILDSSQLRLEMQQEQVGHSCCGGRGYYISLEQFPAQAGKIPVIYIHITGEKLSLDLKYQHKHWYVAALIFFKAIFHDIAADDYKAVLSFMAAALLFVFSMDTISRVISTDENFEKIGKSIGAGVLLLCSGALFFSGFKAMARAEENAVNFKKC